MADDRAGFHTRRLRRRLAAAVTVGTFRSGALAARMAPTGVVRRVARPAGRVASAASRDRRRMVERHLRRVNPDWPPERVRAAALQAFHSYAQYWIESLRLPAVSRQEVLAGLELEGFDEHVLGALEQRAGVILALPHLGGWEWAGRWLSERGHRVTVVVERVEPPELFEWFRRLRSGLGMNVVTLGPGAGRSILRALADNEIVCLLCDRDIGGGGVAVDFFGERTTLPGGPATIALRAGAPIVPAGVYFTDRPNGHLAVVRPPLRAQRAARLRDDVERLTQLLACELEHLIRRAPEQWHLFQPNWPSDPGYRERAR